jgi:hypothetical protein
MLKVLLHLGIAEGTFKASAGWISSVLRKANKVGVKLHGEGMEMSDEDALAVMTKSKEEEFWPKLRSFDLSLDDVYNADQTGLYHQKLPSRVYVDKRAASTMKGVKQMKDKTRITLMVTTSASGARGPLCLVGTSKNPECFRELEVGSLPPIAYTNQANAWFTQKITAWWINNVFWPWHVRRRGDVKCILLLDNCSAHKDLHLVAGFVKPINLIILFFPPNVTSRHQPADMGIIAVMKVGYKSRMLGILLDLYDDCSDFNELVEIRKKIRKGCRGIHYGGKATILDAMCVLNEIWLPTNARAYSDVLYSKRSSVLRCWRKANILTPALCEELNSLDPPVLPRPARHHGQRGQNNSTGLPEMRMPPSAAHSVRGTAAVLDSDDDAEEETTMEVDAIDEENVGESLIMDEEEVEGLDNMAAQLRQLILIG